MKRQLYIAGLIFIILSAINFLGALTNGLLNYSGNLTDDFHETFIIVGMFCTLYFLTTRINIKLDNSLKLPIIRTVFWTVFVSTELFIEPTLDGEPSYILFLNNSGLCTFWNTIFISIPGGIGQNFFVENILLNIIAFGFYEIAVIRTATIVHDQITKVSSTRQKSLREHRADNGFRKFQIPGKLCFGRQRSASKWPALHNRNCCSQ